MMAPDATKVEGLASGFHLSMDRLDLEPQEPPRLGASDLSDPAKFHERLVTWLMNQK
jgi:hypothetical protein